MPRRVLPCDSPLVGISSTVFGFLEGSILKLPSSVWLPYVSVYLSPLRTRVHSLTLSRLPLCSKPVTFHDPSSFLRSFLAASSLASSAATSRPRTRTQQRRGSIIDLPFSVWTIRGMFAVSKHPFRFRDDLQCNAKSSENPPDRFAAVGN